MTSDVFEGVLEVTAMVPGVSEDTGSCTLELLGRDLSTSVPGVPGNEVTYCGVMSIPLGSGETEDWEFRVRYESASLLAQSASMTVGPQS